MNTQHILLWFLLGAVFVGSTFWHILENRKLGRQWRQELSADVAQSLIKFAWLRTIQLLFVLACFLLFVVAYVWQLTDAQNTINDLDKIKTELNQQLAQAVAKAAAPPPVVQQSAAPIASAVPAPNPGDLTAPVPSAPVKKETAAPAPGATIADVYNPETKGNDRQSQMDSLKKRYEDILVIYRFLNKCGRTNPADYTTIMSALQQEISAINAPRGLQSDILTAAQGSYHEMYALSPCNGAGFETLYNQYTSYIKVLSQRYPLKQ